MRILRHAVECVAFAAMFYGIYLKDEALAFVLCGFLVLVASALGGVLGDRRSEDK